MSVGDGLAVLGVEGGGCLVGFQRCRFEFDDSGPSLSGASRGLDTGLLGFGPGLLCGCSELLSFCRRLLSCDLVLRGELCDLGVGCRGHRPLGLGGGLLGLGDSALSVCRGLLRVGELRPCFGESLFELDNSVGGLLGLHSELCLQLVGAGDGLVMLGL